MTTAELEALGLHPAPTAAGRAEAELTFGRRARAWAGAHSQSLMWVPLLLVVVGLVHGWGVGHAPALSDDEGTYMSQAWSTQHEHRLEVYTYWYDHPPLGWMQIALLTWITGTGGAAQHAVVLGRVFMVGFSIISAGLLYVLARRLGIRRLFAGAAVLLFGLSPLAVDYQRMVYLDNIAVPWLLAALVLAASPRRSLWAAAGAGACMAISVLSKETFLLAAPAVFVLLWTRSHPRTRSFCLTAAAVTFVLIGAGYPLYALLKGELLPGPGHVSLWQGITFQLSSRQGSGSLFTAGTPANQTVTSWLHLDFWLLLLGLICLPVMLWSRRFRAIGVALVVPDLVALRGGYLPIPFVIGLLPFSALGVVATLELLAGTTVIRDHAASLSRRARPVAVTAAAVAGAVALGFAWYPGDRLLTHENVTYPVFQAETWIEQHIPRNQRIIADNTVWNDLINHGFSTDLGVVWFQKLDFTENLDPSVYDALPQGWRDFAYVISTPALRSSIAQVPDGFKPVREALAHSTVVASFGSGSASVQVRRIDDPAPLATLQTRKGQTTR